MNDTSSSRSDRLRTKAETLLANVPQEERSESYSDILEVIHELHVHQIELEIQNEELQSAYKALERSKADYMRLYHEAPVGYVVLDQLGIVRKVNKTLATMLDKDAASINGKPFADFLITEDRAIFRARLKAFYRNPIEKQIDVRLNCDGQPFHVSLRAIINDGEHPSITGPSKEMLVTVTDINEQRAYQAALEKNKKELEEILSSISDGFMSLDAELVVQYFNSAAEKLLQVKREEVLHRKLFDAFPMARGSYFEAQYRKVLRTRKVVHFETFFAESPYRDWYEVAVYPHKDGLSVFFRVITERKVAEKALKESEERFRSYVENAPHGILVSAEDGIIRQANPAICEMTGCSREELLDQTLADLFPSGLPPQQLDAFQKPLPTPGETRYTGKDGTMGWAAVSTVELRPERRLHFIEEISERKRIERELLESQRALTLFNRIATLFLTSADEDIFNDVLDLLLVTFECAFGYIGYINSTGDLVCPTMTRHIWEKCQVPGKDTVFTRESWGGLWGRSLQEKRPLMANDNLQGPPGHITLQNALAVPILHHQQLIGQFALANKEGGFSRHDLKLLENAARQTAPILQSLLGRIERKKLQDQLDTLSHQLGKVESLNRMAGAVAHNYNNLLTIIMGGIEIAAGMLPPEYPEIDRNLRDALEASRKGAEIGQMLLMYLGHATQREHRFDLNRSVAKAGTQVAAQKGENVSFSCAIPEQPTMVTASAELVEKLLTNILENAFESLGGQNGSVSARIDTIAGGDIAAAHRFPVEWQPGQGFYARVTIADGGDGIDADNIGKIFDPFYSDKFTGRGMGLAIAMGIIRLCNGGITVKSGREKGSTFEIFLPLADQGD